MMVVNNPLIRPYFFGGEVALGGLPLDFHEQTPKQTPKQILDDFRMTFPKVFKETLPI